MTAAPSADPPAPAPPSARRSFATRFGRALRLRALPLGPLDLPLALALHAAALGGLVIAARQALDVSTRTALLGVIAALAVGLAILLLVGLSGFGEAVLSS